MTRNRFVLVVALLASACGPGQPGGAIKASASKPPLPSASPSVGVKAASPTPTPAASPSPVTVEHLEGSWVDVASPEAGDCFRTPSSWRLDVTAEGVRLTYQPTVIASGAQRPPEPQFYEFARGTRTGNHLHLEGQSGTEYPPGWRDPGGFVDASSTAAASPVPSPSPTPTAVTIDLDFDAKAQTLSGTRNGKPFMLRPNRFSLPPGCPDPSTLAGAFRARG